MEQKKDKEKLQYIQNSKIQKEAKELVHITIEDKREFILDVDRILLIPYQPEKGSHTDCMVNANISPSPSYLIFAKWHDFWDLYPLSAKSNGA